VDGLEGVRLVEINRAALYIRCSTDQQDPSMQVSELREYASRRGFQIVGEFTDIASGATDSRPELNKVLALAKQRKIDVLLTWKVDRLGRSLRHLVNTIGELDAVGVSFVSLKDSLDFTTPAGRLTFNVIGSMAQFERDLIRERVKSGMQNAKRRGVRLGRKRVPVDVVAIQRMRAEGLSFEAISARTGLSVGTVFRAVPRPVAA
jgi:DNA invertase Pin-like site-specific DNA recombinase